MTQPFFACLSRNAADSAPHSRKTRSPIDGSFEDVDDYSEFNPAGELGQVHPPRSVFASSFALHRIKPLEFKDIEKTANGVPIFHPEEPRIQKRGGSAGYGGVYHAEHLDDDGEGGERQSSDYEGGVGQSSDYGSYDDYSDYSSGGPGRGSGEVDYSSDYGSDYGDYTEGRGEHNSGSSAGFQGGDFGGQGGFGGPSGPPRPQGGSGGFRGQGSGSNSPNGPESFGPDYSDYNQGGDNGVFGPSDYGGAAGFSGEYFDY